MDYRVFWPKHEIVLAGCPDASPLTEFYVSVQEDEKKRIIFRIVTFETFEIRYRGCQRQKERESITIQDKKTNALMCNK